MPAALALLSALGCASVRPIATDHPLELKPDQGILVVHVENDVPIWRLRFNKRFDAATQLPAGTHLKLIVVAAGSYRWTTIELEGFDNYYYRFDVPSDSKWGFEVKPGQINYPGQIIVESANDEVYSRGQAWRWTKNRPAIALEKLLEEFPDLLATYPLANARTERDDFLAHYQNVAPHGAKPKRQGLPQ